MRNVEPNLPFKAVLWDIDGTLADSEPVHLWSFEEAGRQLGLELSPGFHSALLGKSDAETHAWLIASCGLGMSLNDWMRLRIAVYLQRLDRVSAHPRALAAWQRLDALGVAQAAVSNSDRMIVNANLARLGLVRPGLVSISRNDVVNGKPDPEPYLRAASLIGCDPSQVAVVEDSLSGMEAGRRAGMRVYMMPWYQLPAPGRWCPFQDLERELSI